MEAKVIEETLRSFQELVDPRGVNTLHRFTDIFTIALLAILCGAEGWVQVAQFARAKEKWLRTFLYLRHGIPSHDTFGRVFARLNPDVFEKCFVAWVATLVKTTNGKLVAIDGKALRRSFERAWDKSGMAHLVSAFVAENRMVFGQIAVESKSNEITAIPKLLELLDLKGAMVTIDAMGCQKDIAAKIVEKKAGYLLAVKENQPKLYAKVKAMLDEAILDRFQGTQFDHVELTEGNHGRIETRRVWCTGEVHWLKLEEEWAGLQSIVAVESVRQVIGGATSTERRYYISTLDGHSAQKAGEAARGHWGIENKVHWVLDVAFDEDQCRIRKGHGAENFSRLRRMSLNMLRRDTTNKVGIKTKRLMAGWDNDYLLSLLQT